MSPETCFRPTVRPFSEIDIGQLQYFEIEARPIHAHRQGSRDSAPRVTWPSSVVDDDSHDAFFRTMQMQLALDSLCSLKRHHHVADRNDRQL